LLRGVREARVVDDPAFVVDHHRTVELIHGVTFRRRVHEIASRRSGGPREGLPESVRVAVSSVACDAGLGYAAACARASAIPTVTAGEREVEAACPYANLPAAITRRTAATAAADSVPRVARRNPAAPRGSRARSALAGGGRRSLSRALAAAGDPEEGQEERDSGTAGALGVT